MLAVKSINYDTDKKKTKNKKKNQKQSYPTHGSS